MSTGSDRIVCARCGANNFATQAACWKCNAPLSAASVSGNPAPTPASGGFTSPANSAAPLANPALRFPVAPSLPPPDKSVAIWSAAILGILFPIFAVPVGIVFLMLDDRRRIEVGKATIIWGVVGTILQFIVTGFFMNEALGQVRGLVPMLQKGARPTASPDSAPIKFPDPN